MKPKVAAAAGGGEKGRGVDPLLPRFKCQECHRALVVVGVESFPDRLPAHANSGTSTLPVLYSSPFPFMSL
jgi:beclin 1